MGIAHVRELIKTKDHLSNHPIYIWLEENRLNYKKGHKIVAIAGYIIKFYCMN